MKLSRYKTVLAQNGIDMTHEKVIVYRAGIEHYQLSLEQSIEDNNVMGSSKSSEHIMGVSDETFGLIHQSKPCFLRQAYELIAIHISNFICLWNPLTPLVSLDLF